MGEGLRLTIQVIISALIIFGVLWWMWRIPGKPVTDSAAAPVLALGSVWAGLASVIVGGWLWLASYQEIWVLIHVVTWSLALTLSGLALWIYRHTPPEQMPEEVFLQRTQARIGLAFGLLSVMLWYLFVLTHKPPLTPIGS